MIGFALCGLPGLRSRIASTSLEVNRPGARVMRGLGPAGAVGGCEAGEEVGSYGTSQGASHQSS